MTLPHSTWKRMACLSTY